MRVSPAFSFLLAVVAFPGAGLTSAQDVAIASQPADAAPFTQVQFLSELSREISSHFNFEGDLQLDLQRAWAPPARLATRWSASVLEFPALASPSMLVRCRLLADGAPAGDVTLVVRASLWRDAWATRQPVVTGTPFDATLLEARRVDMLREREVLPASVGDRSMIFARGVPAGRMLTWRDIARRPLVRKGGAVEVSATDGLLLVTMKALALENGAQGDTITVRNPESRRDFAAVVVDENHVQVRF